MSSGTDCRTVQVNGGRETLTVDPATGGVALPGTVQDIVDSQREGGGLVLTLADGRIIVVRDFYAAEVAGGAVLLTVDDLGNRIELSVSEEGDIEHLDRNGSAAAAADMVAGDDAAREESEGAEEVSLARLEEMFGQHVREFDAFEQAAWEKRIFRQAEDADGGEGEGSEGGGLFSGGGLALIGGVLLAAALAGGGGGSDGGGGGGGGGLPPTPGDDGNAPPPGDDGNAPPPGDDGNAPPPDDGGPGIGDDGNGGDGSGGDGDDGNGSTLTPLDIIIENDGDAQTVQAVTDAGLQGVTEENFDNLKTVLRRVFGTADQPTEARSSLPTDAQEQLKPLQALISSVNEYVGEGEIIRDAVPGSLRLEIDSPLDGEGDVDRVVYIEQREDYLPSEVSIAPAAAGTAPPSSSVYGRIETYEFDSYGNVRSKSIDDSGASGTAADGSADRIEWYRAPTSQDTPDRTRIVDGSLLTEVENCTYDYVTTNNGSEYRLKRVEVDAGLDDIIDEKREYSYTAEGVRETEKVSTGGDSDGNFETVVTRYYDSAGEVYDCALHDGGGVAGSADGIPDRLEFTDGRAVSLDLTDALAKEFAGIVTIDMADDVGGNGETALTISDTHLTTLAKGASNYQLVINGESDDTVRFTGDIYRTGVTTNGLHEYQGTSGRVYIDQTVEVTGTVDPLVAVLRHLDTATLAMVGLTDLNGVTGSNFEDVKTVIGAFSAGTVRESLLTTRVQGLVNIVRDTDHVPAGASVESARWDGSVLTLDVSTVGDSGVELRIELTLDGESFSVEGEVLRHDANADGTYEREETDADNDGNEESIAYNPDDDGPFEYTLSDIEDDGTPDMLTFAKGVTHDLEIGIDEAAAFAGIGTIDLAGDSGGNDGDTTLVISNTDLATMAGTVENYRIVITGETDDTVEFTGGVFYQTGSVTEDAGGVQVVRREYQGTDGKIAVDPDITVEGVLDPRLAVLRHLEDATLDMFGLAGLTGVDTDNLANLKTVIGAYSSSTTPKREDLTVAQMQGLVSILDDTDFVPSGAKVVLANVNQASADLLLGISTDANDINLERFVGLTLDANFAVTGNAISIDSDGNGRFEYAIIDLDNDGTPDTREDYAYAGTLRTRIHKQHNDDDTGSFERSETEYYRAGIGDAELVHTIHNTDNAGDAERLEFADGVTYKLALGTADATGTKDAADFTGIDSVQLAGTNDSGVDGITTFELTDGALTEMAGSERDYSFAIDSSGNNDRVTLSGGIYRTGETDSSGRHEYQGTNGKVYVDTDVTVSGTPDPLPALLDNISRATEATFGLVTGISGITTANLESVRQIVEAFGGTAVAGNALPAIANLTVAQINTLVGIVNNTNIVPTGATVIEATLAASNTLVLDVNTDADSTAEQRIEVVLNTSTLAPTGVTRHTDTDSDGTADDQTDFDSAADGVYERTEVYSYNADGTLVRTDYDGIGGTNADGSTDLSAIDTDADGATNRIEHYTRSSSGAILYTRSDNDADGTPDTLTFADDVSHVFTLGTGNVADFVGITSVTLAGGTGATTFQISDAVLGMLANGNTSYDLTIDGGADDSVTFAGNISPSGYMDSSGRIEYMGTVGKVFVAADITVTGGISALDVILADVSGATATLFSLAEIDGVTDGNLDNVKDVLEAFDGDTDNPLSGLSAANVQGLVDIVANYVPATEDIVAVTLNTGDPRTLALDIDTDDEGAAANYRATFELNGDLGAVKASFDDNLDSTVDRVEIDANADGSPEERIAFTRMDDNADSTVDWVETRTNPAGQPTRKIATTYADSDEHFELRITTSYVNGNEDTVFTEFDDGMGGPRRNQGTADDGTVDHTERRELRGQNGMESRLERDLDADGVVDRRVDTGYRPDNTRSTSTIYTDDDNDSMFDTKRLVRHDGTGTRDVSEDSFDGTSDTVTSRRWFFYNAEGRRVSVLEDGQADGTPDTLRFDSGITYRFAPSAAEADAYKGMTSVFLADPGATTFVISDAVMTELADDRDNYRLTIDGQGNDTVVLSGFTAGGSQDVGGTDYDVYTAGTSTLLVHQDIVVQSLLQAVLSNLASASRADFTAVGVDVPETDLDNLKEVLEAYDDTTTPARADLTQTQVQSLVAIVSNDYYVPAGATVVGATAGTGELTLEVDTADDDSAADRTVELDLGSDLIPTGAVVRIDADEDGNDESVESDGDANGTPEYTLLDDGAGIAADDGTPDRLEFTDGIVSSLVLTGDLASEFAGIGTIDLADDVDSSNGATTLSFSDAHLTALAGSDSSYELTINGTDDDTVQLSGGIYDTGVARGNYKEYLGTSGKLLIDSDVDVDGTGNALEGLLAHIDQAPAEMFGLAGVTGVSGANLANVRAVVGAYDGTTTPKLADLTQAQVQSLVAIVSNDYYVPAGATVVGATAGTDKLTLMVDTADGDSAADRTVELDLDSDLVPTGAVVRVNADEDGNNERVEYDGDVNGTPEYTLYDDGAGAAGDDGTPDRLAFTDGLAFGMTLTGDLAAEFAGIGTIDLADDVDSSNGATTLSLSDAHLTALAGSDSSYELTINGTDDDMVQLSGGIYDTGVAQGGYKEYLGTSGKLLIDSDVDVDGTGNALEGLLAHIDQAPAEMFGLAGVTGVGGANLANVRAVVSAYDGTTAPKLVDLTLAQVQSLVGIVNDVSVVPANASIVSATAGNGRLTLEVDTDDSDSAADRTVDLRLSSSLSPTRSTVRIDSDGNGAADRVEYDYNADGSIDAVDLDLVKETPREDERYGNDGALGRVFTLTDDGTLDFVDSVTYTFDRGDMTNSSGNRGVNSDFARLDTVNLAGGTGGRTTFALSGIQLSELWNNVGPQTMTINGGTDDTVILSGFASAADASVEGTTYKQYTYVTGTDTFTLRVDSDIVVQSPLQAVLADLAGASRADFDAVGVTVPDAHLNNLKEVIEAYGPATTPARADLTVAQVESLVAIVGNDYYVPAGATVVEATAGTGKLTLMVDTADSDTAADRSVELDLNGGLLPTSATVRIDVDEDGNDERVEYDGNANGTPEHTLYDDTAGASDDGMPDRLVFTDGIVSSLTLTGDLAVEFAGIGTIDLADDVNGSNGATVLAISDGHLTALAGEVDNYELTINGTRGGMVQLSGGIYDTGVAQGGYKEYLGTSGKLLIDSDIIVFGTGNALEGLLAHIDQAPAEMFGLAGVTGVSGANLANVRAVVRAYDDTTTPALISLMQAQVQSLVGIVNDVSVVPANASIVSATAGNYVLTLGVDTNSDSTADRTVELRLSSSLSPTRLTVRIDSSGDGAVDRVEYDYNADGSIDAADVDLEEESPREDVFYGSDGDLGRVFTLTQDGTLDFMDGVTYTFDRGDMTTSSGNHGVNSDFARLDTVNLAGGTGGRTTFALSGAQLSELWGGIGSHTTTINGGTDDTVILSGFTEASGTVAGGTAYDVHTYDSGDGIITLRVGSDIMVQSPLQAVLAGLAGASRDDFAAVGVTFPEAHFDNVKAVIGAYDASTTPARADLTADQLMALLAIVENEYYVPAGASVVGATAVAIKSPVGSSDLILEVDTTGNMSADRTVELRIDANLSPLSATVSIDSNWNGNDERVEYDNDANGTPEHTILDGNDDGTPDSLIFGSGTSETLTDVISGWGVVEAGESIIGAEFSHGVLMLSINSDSDSSPERASWLDFGYRNEIDRIRTIYDVNHNNTAERIETDNDADGAVDEVEYNFDDAGDADFTVYDEDDDGIPDRLEFETGTTFELTMTDGLAAEIAGIRTIDLADDAGDTDGDTTLVLSDANLLTTIAGTVEDYVLTINGETDDIVRLPGDIYDTGTDVPMTNYREYSWTDGKIRVDTAVTVEVLPGAALTAILADPDTATVANFTEAGITGVDADNLANVREVMGAFHEHATAPLSGFSQAQVQELVDSIGEFVPEGAASISEALVAAADGTATLTLEYSYDAHSVTDGSVEAKLGANYQVVSVLDDTDKDGTPEISKTYTGGVLYYTVLDTLGGPRPERLEFGPDVERTLSLTEIHQEATDQDFHRDLSSIVEIDLSGRSNIHLIISSEFIVGHLNFGELSLEVTGNAGDTLTFTGSGWSDSGEYVEDGVNWMEYELDRGEAYVYVDPEITVSEE